MFCAYFFWGQEFERSFIAQRGIYSFVFLSVLLFVQPTEDDIFEAIKWFSFITIGIWILSIFFHSIITTITDKNLEMRENTDATDIGFNVKGYRFVVFYLYFTLGKLAQKYTFKIFLTSVILFIFVILFQNRSMLIGGFLAYMYVLWKFQSKHKVLIFGIIGVVVFIASIYMSDILMHLWDETNENLSNPDYARWAELNYYLYEYSPNWICFIFGNGAPSAGYSFLGNLMWLNFDRGLYQSDLGMMGMWTTYGIIPVATIYFVALKTLFKNTYSLYLKFFAFHLCVVPTIFCFWGGDTLMLIVFFIYIYAYQTVIRENNNVSIKNGINFSYAKQNIALRQSG
jgi:hypothetical protein